MPTAAMIADHDLVIGQPPDWDPKKQGHCGGLPVRFEQVDGIQYMRSAWEMTPTEAQMLLCGAKLVLSVSAPQHPVVQMGVDSLPADFRPQYFVRPFTSTDAKPMVRVETLWPGGDILRRIFVEQPVDEGGLSIAVGRAVEAVEELVRVNGWKA